VTDAEIARAVAVILRSVAVADRRFDNDEFTFIERAIVEASCGDASVYSALVGELRTLSSSDADLAKALETMRCSTPASRRRLLDLAEQLAFVDGKMTPKEKERLAELRAVLAD
jgi:hypothetical protein